MNHFKIKTLIMAKHSTKISIIIIDTGNEYEEICKSLKGSIIDCNKFNPDEIDIKSYSLILIKTKIEALDMIHKKINNIIKSKFDCNNILFICDNSIILPKLT